MRVPLAFATTAAIVALAGCGSSKPAYCTDRTNLNNSIKGLTSLTASSGISGLKSQVNMIQSDATAVVNSAKSDFPSETSAITSSVDALKSFGRRAVVESDRCADRHGHQRRGQRSELGEELLGRVQFDVQLTT